MTDWLTYRWLGRQGEIFFLVSFTLHLILCSLYPQPLCVQFNDIISFFWPLLSLPLFLSILACFHTFLFPCFLACSHYRQCHYFHLFLFLFYLSSGLRHIKSLYTMVDWYSHQVTRMLWSDWEDLQLREVRAVRSKISLISIGNASTSIGYSWKVVSMFEHFLVVLNYYVSPFLFFRLEYKSSSFHFSHFTFFYFSFFLFFYFLLAPPSPEFKLADQGDDFDENDYDDADVRYYSSLCNL